MSQWKNDDSAANSVLWGVVGYNKTGNSVNRDNFFGNNTVSAYVSGLTVGQFGVDPTEISVSNGALVSFTITNPGSGYTANAAVTVSGNGTANAEANSTGRIQIVNIEASGNGYSATPTVSIAAPTAISFNANSAVDGTLEFITLSGNVLQDGDYITYYTATGNTVLTNLTNNSPYYVVSSNSTGVKLSSSRGGTAINLTKGLTETGHFLKGETATAAAVVSGLSGKGFHAGWVVRKVGTGGRAGRVQYETLVAMGSMTGDASDDTFIKDS